MAMIERHGEPKRAIFLVRYSRELEPDALTGQAIDTLTLGANTATDIHGDTVATIANEPCWVYDSGEDKMFLEVDASAERLSYAFPYVSTLAHSGLIEFIANAAGTGDILRIGNRDGSNPYLYIEHDGTNFEIHHHNGTGEVTSAVAKAVSAGSLYSIRWVMLANGSVQIAYSEDGGTEVEASATAAHTATTWSEAKIHIIAATTGAGAEKSNVGLLAISSDPTATLSELQYLF